MDFKKRLKTRLHTAIAYLAIGLILTIAGYATKTDNHFIPAFGIGLFVNSILRMLQYRRITRNETTVKQQEIAETDERNLMILERSKSWAFSIYIFFTGTILIILAILGSQEMLVQMISYSICLLALLYWICYYILKRKY